jgi:hypothetical protein
MAFETKDKQNKYRSTETEEEVFLGTSLKRRAQFTEIYN